MKKIHLFYTALSFLGVVLPSAIYACETRSIRVVGNSLTPVILDGSTVRVEIGRDCFEKLARGDVVLFVSGALEIPIAKKVVGLPGDRWTVSNAGTIVVNGRRVKNSVGKIYRLNAERTRMLQIYEESYSGVIPENSYLLMGESISGSLDSSRLGLIHIQDIIGRVVGE